MAPVRKRLLWMALIWFAPISATADKLACETDPILQRVSEQYVLDPKVTSEIVKARMQALGSDITTFKVNRSKALTPAKANEYVRAKHLEFHASVRCGVVFSNGVGMLIAAPNLGHLDVKGQGSRLQIVASWNKDYRDPELWIVLKNGKMERRALPSANTQSAKLNLELTEPARKVQLLATGKAGRRPLAERWLSFDKGNTVSTSSPEAWILQLRTKAHAPLKLRRHKTLDAAALSHSKNACEQGRIVHDLGQGYVKDRLEQRGVDAQSVGEVVSRSATVSEALQKLADSPAHYSVLTDKKFTEWGVGIVPCKDKQHYVTLILATGLQPMKH